MGTGKKKPYNGNLRKCTKCHFYHNGPCTQKCHKCNKVGHFARKCRSSGNANVVNAQRNNGENPKGNGCFECGSLGHFKMDCPKLKNKDGGKVNAPGWVYAVGNAEKRGNASRDPDSNVITGTFLLNNRYTSILFDTGADRSFISTAFSSLIDVVPTLLGNSYDVGLADGKRVGRCHAVIVCDEKLIRIPYGNETLTVRGNKSNNRRESRLTVISCSKAQEYMAKGCQIFLAQISAKKEEDRSDGKQLEDVPVRLLLVAAAAVAAAGGGDVGGGGNGVAVGGEGDKVVAMVVVVVTRVAAAVAAAAAAAAADGGAWSEDDIVDRIDRKVGSIFGNDIGLDIPKQILEAQIEALKPENLKNEDVGETTEKIVLIKQRIQAAQDRQKSYADMKRKPMEFEVKDRVMLKVSPWKGVVRFGKRGKLNPRYVGPFKVLAKVGKVAYKLELPKS
nr:putative reverse transcriptase domain-containing protein [Tanacetum cinerariifolium]